MGPCRQSAERLQRRAWPAIHAFGIFVALVYPVACGGSTAPPSDAGDASSQGGSAGSAGSPGSAGDAGQSGSGGAGGLGGGGAGGQGGASGTGGSADSGAPCSPSRDGGTRADPDAGPPGTFPCPGPPYTHATLFCRTGSEYCAWASFNGANMVPPICLPLPSGCSSCDCILKDAWSCVLAPWTTCQQFARCSAPPNSPGPFVSCILP